ncbi:hypothetical protein PC129_g8680 [Phytophthora cactorum]|uniref:Uncharacterized protein n=1 Tax=Phytophthora cactorum TaxID=29920 RepID=A0A329SA76_9STRA|nr:hypothetical protein PC112_g10817 [Phytophthora cactorum]KAG2825188.1 hypothetical protein PC111_g9496 [Phytophthora cactorum]KAG2856783.1 hypothetical protein PC113_g11260 [Phytophthora cactorum]KAG2904714.1 hypothetical protein PC114_g11781 [Phytophthora cactorum]KAG2938087.1 hypothetical protein PC117_g11399 [Phytophthora cactorum]
MGNAASGETEPTMLKEELADMHRSLQALSTRCRPPPVLRPGQISVDNVIISTREDMKVVLGPVVGKVEFQCARVLLEVNRRAVVTAHVSTLDVATNSMVEVPQYRVLVQCEADQPAIFKFDRLVPGKRYTVTFGGVRKGDVERNRASFQTQSLEHGNRLNVVAVSGDNVYDLQSGETTLWKDVRERVEQGETQTVLHLGGQVAMERMFDKAVQLLLLHGEGLTNDATDWSMMEAKAMVILRSAYRSQWTLSPNLRFVLANASNLMMWNDADIYPRFTTRDEFYIDHEQPTLRMQAIRTVTRSARRLYHEYQRQLWDDDFKQLVEREAEMLVIAEKALASTAQIFALSNQIPKTAEELELLKKRHDIESARRVEKNLRALEAEKAKLEKHLVSYNQLLAPQRGEEFLFEIGSIGILALDLRSSRLEPGGSQARENEPLSNVQWQFIEETLENANIQLLLVCSEAPLIDDAILEAKISIDALSGEVETSWSANSPAQTRLLSQLFDWKVQQPSRKFIVLGGANPVRCFAKMRVKDSKLRTEAEQLTVGAISAAPHKLMIPKRSGLLHDRFEFEHLEEVITTKCFVALRLESGQSSVVEMNRIGKDQQSENLPKVLIGPVVGWVDDWCAVVLLEVDRDADVVCLVENPLTHESRRVFQRFFADQTNSFFITHLRSGHYYRVLFENIQHPEHFQASFTTVAKSSQQFDIVALCNDSRPLRIPAMMNNGDKKPHLWHAIAENTVEMPFVGLNLTVHLGGQFFPESNVHIHEALVYASNNVTSQSPFIDSEDPTTAIILSRFREMYRATWNAPGVRESLAHGAHLLLTNGSDQLSANNQDGKDQQNVSVRELLTKFHIQYQNLLLPPSKRLRGDEVRWRKPLYHSFGVFGLFVLPIQELGGSCIHECTWEALRALLATPKLSTLLLVSTEALIDESLENIREKASMDAAYRRKFGFYQQDVVRLLELLFNWQRDEPVTEKEPQIKKQVVLLSGSRYQSFNSVVREVYSSEDPLTSTVYPNLPTANSRALFQHVVGPLQASCSGLRPSALFSQGTLLGRYTFRHSFVRKLSSTAAVALSTDVDTTEVDVVRKEAEMKLNSDVTSQLVHLLLGISDKNQTDALEAEPTECPTSFGICSFVSHDPIEADKDPDNEKPDSHAPNENQIRCCPVGSWQLSTSLPSWLRELLAQVPTEYEDEGIKERFSFLREKESEIQTAFQQSSNIVDGLVTLSRAKQCTAALTDSFESAHRLGKSAFQEKFPDAPSRFIVAFTLQQLRTSEPPTQPLLSSGAVEFEQYALVFHHSFVNSWLFNERLNEFWR